MRGGLLRALLRAARRTADGDRAAALRLALGRIRSEPVLADARTASLVVREWARLVREELGDRR
jgi:hypothetical protein